MDKPAFQNGILYHRILVPASGFYEWNHLKEKNSFTRSDAATLYIAGFCDWFENERRFVILTTAANDSMVKVHDRMPLILEKEHNIPVTLLCDTNHVLQSDYGEVITVGAGADAADFKLVSICQKGDIVVTQDYGVAAMILAKEVYGIHQSGKWYTNENIDQMLMERHLNKKARRSSSKNELTFWL